MSETNEVVFSLECPPFSINKMYYKRTFNRTQAAREWAFKVFNQLRKPYAQQQLTKFREGFDKSKHGIKISLTFFYPRGILLTKAGHISSKSMDLSNVEKPLIDLIFDKKYNDREYPDGCPNLNLNDVTICDMVSKKRPSSDDKYSIVIALETFDLDEWSVDGE